MSVKHSKFPQFVLTNTADKKADTVKCCCATSNYKVCRLSSAGAVVSIIPTQGIIIELLDMITLISQMLSKHSVLSNQYDE